MTKTALYRHFNAKGQLLYVGISDCLSARDKHHVHTSHWHDLVTYTETQWCLSREHALDLERVAIRHERPKYNVAHSKPVEKKPAFPDLLSEIERTRSITGLSKPDFGRAVLNDPRLVYDMEQGRELRRATEARVREKMAGLKAEASA